MSHAPTGILASRHQQIRQAIVGRSLDALVVTSLPNITYLTNFSGSSAAVVMTEDRILFFTDSRYHTTVTERQAGPCACPGFELVVVEGSYDATVTAHLARLGARQIGFEAAHLTVSRHEWIASTLTAQSPGSKLVATEGVVEVGRVVKDAYEVGVLREAAQRLSDVATAAFADVRTGLTEREVAGSIDRRIREAGFERPAFETIVASGPNSALPHARPTERKLTEGDLVVLDFGGVYDSYCVDLTRTVAVGRASARSREVHAAVLSAHDAAVAAVVPGQSRFAIDAAARARLEAAGMADAFGHGTGHGLGIEIHEDPRIVKRRPDVDTRGEQVALGMVFTIEPGAYFPGWGGVRIEDDVLVTKGGVETLTRVTTELLEL
ncbi:MAG: M24 family metallopeptidase [Luteitalea sp.]|nr:M24 family metallopeptidase [Luteitalea sp.]